MKKQNYESYATSLDADAGLRLNVKTAVAIASSQHLMPEQAYPSETI